MTSPLLRLYKDLVMNSSRGASFWVPIILCCLVGQGSMAEDGILVFSKNGDQFQAISDGIEREFKDRMKVVEYEISNETEPKEFEKQISKNAPRLIVLMDNKAVSLAKGFYRKNPKSDLQSVAIMGLNLKNILKSSKNICGIAYEVPLYTLLTQLRYLMKNRKLEKVLVFYRGSLFKGMIKTAKERLKFEKIQLNAIDVENKERKPSSYLEKEGPYLVKNTKFDAVYVMLDSGLLSRDLFINFWLKGAKESSLPFVAGVKNFVEPKMDFAMFGMSPNLPDLISQTSQMIENILEEGETCQDLGVEELIGVNKFWNKKKAKKLDIKLNPKAESSISILE